MLACLASNLAHENDAVRRCARYTQADVRNFDLGRTFPLVTAPFRVVQHLLTRDDQKAWLNTVHRHLEPGGTLVFDVFQPDLRRVVNSGHFAYGAPRVELERTDPHSGKRVRRIARTNPRPVAQQIDIRFRWERQNEEGGWELIAESGTTMRWFLRAELENLLELAGFNIVDYWGSFSRDPHGEASQHQIIEARRR